MKKDVITRKESTRYPGLFVKKYTRRVFYDNLWADYEGLTEARGHVELADGTIVIRPFTKIFNRNENGTDIDYNEEVIAVRKVNGFMACATYVPQVDEVVVSTTGSLDSDFVKMAEEYITPEIKGMIRNSAITDGIRNTYMFEIVHPNDPHIIKEYTGAHLIGVRDVDSEDSYMSDFYTELYLDDVARDLFRIHRPDWKVCKFSEIVQEAKTCKHEGFVVYGQSSKTALKIKSPYYLTLKAAARKVDIMKLNRLIVDEEFYPLIEHLIEIEKDFNVMDEQSRLDYMKKYLEK